MGLLERGQAMVNRTHKAGGGSTATVTYTRVIGGVNFTLGGLVIRHGRALASSRTEGDIGLAVQSYERVFLIEAADLNIPGVGLTTPAAGDRITEAGSFTQTWTVTPPETGEPPWRYSDQTRTLYRVFCKRAPA